MDTIICAHRGLSDAGPENTLWAFQAALEKGMSVELDVDVTADGALVVLHDNTVDRTTDGAGRIGDLDLGKVKELDAGSWYGPAFAGLRIPTFDEALETVRQHAQVTPAIALDLKNEDPALATSICDKLDRHGMMNDIVGIGRIIWSATLREEFSRVSGERFNAAVVAETPDDLEGAIKDPYASWVYGRFVPSPPHVRSVHSAGKRLLVSGDEVSRDVQRAHDAYLAGPDMVLTWHPTQLYGLVQKGVT